MTFTGDGLAMAKHLKKEVAEILGLNEIRLSLTDNELKALKKILNNGYVGDDEKQLVQDITNEFLDNKMTV